MDFTLDKEKSFVENTYQNKSYVEIHRGLKRPKEINEISALHVQPNKKWKHESGKPPEKRPFSGECFYCYGNGHRKEDCRVRQTDIDNKVFRSFTHTNPQTKRTSTDGKPVRWTKGPKGEIIVSYVRKVAEKKKRNYSESDESSNSPTPPCSP